MTLTNMQVSAEVLEDMMEHATEQFPLESCGLLAGHGEKVEKFVRTENILTSKHAFAINPAELARFLRKIRETNLEFLGIYHSHPSSSAWPSTRDRQEFHYTEVSYWIISLKTLSFRGQSRDQLDYPKRNLVKGKFDLFVTTKGKTIDDNILAKSTLQVAVRCFSWQSNHFVMQPFTVTAS